MLTKADTTRSMIKDRIEFLVSGETKIVSIRDTVAGIIDTVKIFNDSDFLKNLSDE